MNSDFNIQYFNVSISEAKLIQNELRGKVHLSGYEIGQSEIEFIGGADVSFLNLGEKKSLSEEISNCEQAAYKSGFRSKRTLAIAGIVVLNTGTGEIVEQAVASLEIDFPYIPGYLSFREGPAVFAAMKELSSLPGVMIYDGCGIAHPRGLGLASHMGVLTGIPSIGCAKSLLCGETSEPGFLRGEKSEIILGGKVVGTCLRTKNKVKPVFVSPGHLINIEDAVEIVLRLSIKYRLPEPTRLAHNLVTKERKAYQNLFINLPDNI